MQTARLDELDDAAWQLPRVDPTGWLAELPAPVSAGVSGGGSAGSPAAASAGAPARPGTPAGRSDGRSESPVEPPPSATAHTRPRRPRRTAEARAARDLELVRRRRLRRGRQGLWRRQGRVLAIDAAVGRAAGSTGATGVADRVGSCPPDGWIAGSARIGGPVVASGRRIVRPVAHEGYRIGRWERLALSVLVGATLVVLAIRLLGALTAGPEASMDVTVKPGDTLWSIATDAAPDRDPRAVIDEIRRLNQVTGDLVRAGEVLRVPASPDQGSAG